MKNMDRLSYGLLQNILEVIEEESFESEEKTKESFELILSLIETTVEEKQSDDIEFSNWVCHVWMQPLFFFEAFISLSKDILGLFLSEFVPEKDFELFDVIRRMHGRACLISEEILLLMKNGYADGALSRWRSLHEIFVMTRFIHKHGNRLAKRFLDYEVIESKHILSNYKKYEDQLNLISISDEEICYLENEVKRYTGIYGKEFDSVYGWAKEVFPEGRITFARIERDVNLSHWRPYYQMASYPTHAEIKGIMFQLGLVTYDKDHILTGPTDMGLADSGIFTTYTLNKLNTILSGYINQAKKPQIELILDYLEEEITEQFISINNIQRGVSSKK